MKQSIRPNHLGNISLSSCPKITIKRLVQDLRSEKKRLLQKMFPEAVIVSKSCNYGGERYYFLCPVCQKSILTLYEDPIGGSISCQRCIGYSYQTQRFKGMPEERIGK